MGSLRCSLLPSDAAAQVPESSICSIGLKKSVCFLASHSQRQLGCKARASKVSLIDLVHRQRQRPRYHHHPEQAPTCTKQVDDRDDVQTRAVAVAIHEIADEKQLSYEAEEARAVLACFLNERGLVLERGEAVSAFMSHMVYQLHCRFQTRYLSGRELTTLEIRDTMLSFLKDLESEHGEQLHDFILGFGSSIISSSSSSIKGIIKSSDSVARTRRGRPPQKRPALPPGDQPPALSYLHSLGLSSEQIATLVMRYPVLVNYDVESNMKPAVNFCLGLGIELAEIPKLVLKRPQLLRCAVHTNLDPTRIFLEDLGIRRESWRKIMLAFPHILTYSRSKITGIADFLIEVGVPRDMLGKTLTRFPHVVGYSVEDNLRPTVEFLREFGLQNVGGVIVRSPQIFGLSLEANIKPTLSFFLDRGFSAHEMTLMLGRFPQLLSFSTSQNLTPKWDFFTGMDRARTEIVDFPQYFSYNLERRIKPRYEAVVSNGLKMSLNRMLTCSGLAFQKMIDKELLITSKIDLGQT